jgi:hypothetical protein
MLNAKFEMPLESVGTKLVLVEAASARYLMTSGSDCDKNRFANG